MFFIPIFSKYLPGDLPSEAFNRSYCCKALLLDDSGIPGYTSDLSYFFTVELNLFYILVLPYLRHMQPEACNFIKKETLAQVFFCELCKILKNIFFTEHHRKTASLLKMVKSDTWHGLIYLWWVNAWTKKT